MAKTTTREAPFDAKGNLQHFPQGGYSDTGYLPPVMRTVEPFQARMRLDEGVTSGRSAKYVHVIDVETGARYPMFIADLLELLLIRSTITGVIYLYESDRWYVRKRGQNFGLALLTS